MSAFGLYPLDQRDDQRIQSAHLCPRFALGEKSVTSGALRQEFGTQATDALAALGAEVTVELITSNVVLRVIEEAGHDRR